MNIKLNEKKLNPREQKILLVSCYGHFLSHYNMLTFPAVVIPMAGLLKMEMAQVLGISFWQYLLFGITALPWGLAADRYGTKPMLLLFYTGAGISGFLASVFMQSPMVLTFALASIGFFSGIYHPAGLGLISKEIKRISVAMGFNGMFGNLGLAMAPLCAGLVTWLSGPKAAYVVLGVLNIIGAVLMLSMPFTETSAESNPAKNGEENKLSAFMILLVAMMLGGIVYRGATVITPAYFELKNQAIFQWVSSLLQGGGSPNLVATTITSTIFLFGMLGQYLGGMAADRFDPRRCYFTFHAATVPFAVLMALFSEIPLVIFALVYFFFLLGMQPAENTLVAAYTPKKFHSSAFGMKFVLTFGVGALSVKMVAFLQAAKNIELVYLVLALISAVLVAVIAVLVVHTQKLDHLSAEKNKYT